MLAYLLLSLAFTFSVHSQVSLLVRWNGLLISESPANIDDRVLIYHDEIDVRTNASGGVPDGPGVLVCRHSDTPGDVRWSRPVNEMPLQSNNHSDFRIFEATYGGYTRVQLARTRSIPQDATSNEGLWTCNGGGLSTLHVAIYARVTGHGAITTNVVTLLSSSFKSNPPTFTLVGDTTGGPPTTAVWLRNGETLENDSRYSISTRANPNGDQEGRVNSRYRSIIVVTGMLPGVYEYRVDNRATSSSRSDSITVEGGDPKDLMVLLVGNSTVRVSWTSPEGIPSGGYHIIDEENGLNRSALSSPQEFMLPVGDYNIQVTYTSLHLPNGSAGPQTITVLGALQPKITSVLQPIPTVVIVSWTQPLLSFRPDYYQLTLAQVTESRQNCCNDFIDSRSERVVGGSGSFTNLKDSSVYRIKVTANFQIGGNSYSTSAETEISTGKVATIRDNTAGTTGRDVGVSVTVTFLLTTAGCAAVVVVGYALYRYYLHQKRKITPADMKKNVAYAEHTVRGGAESVAPASTEDTIYVPVN